MLGDRVLSALVGATRGECLRSRYPRRLDSSIWPSSLVLSASPASPSSPFDQVDMLHMWLRDVPCPGVHDLAALLQQVGTPVGGFDGVFDDVS